MKPETVADKPMAENHREEDLELLQSFLQPWHTAVEAPAEAQRKVLSTLLKGYAQTDYGKTHGAAHIESIADYRRAFPVVTYEDYKPLIQRVMAGETGLLLNEEPIGWAITRGTTGDESKFIPMTPTDLQMRVSAGRAMLNYVVRGKCPEVLEGANLNLNFPSVIGKVQVGEKELEYGYSSGIYLKHVSAYTPIRSVPTQEEIDALGEASPSAPGKPASSWPIRNAKTKTLPWWAVFRPQLFCSGAICAALMASTLRTYGRYGL